MAAQAAIHASLRACNARGRNVITLQHDKCRMNLAWMAACAAMTKIKGTLPREQNSSWPVGLEWSAVLYGGCKLVAGPGLEPGTYGL